MSMWGDPVRCARAGSLLAALALAAAIAGCAGRPGADVLTPVAAAPGVKTVPVYVATTRKRETPTENVFTAELADGLNFAAFTVSIPPTHQPGHVEWPDGAPDPRTSFAVTHQAVLGEAQFRDAVAPARARGKKRRVLIFVHGFNNTFPESLYRLAQVSADAKIEGTAVLFAWPSVADVGSYDADRSAALHSRDNLMALLKMVTASPQVGNVMLVAHSMGGLLTAEALRELRVQRQDRVIARLHRVVLAAPDIDIDEFRTQVQTIGPLNPPLVVLVSKDDAALRFSRIVGGSRARAGALDINNPLVREAALKAKVQIVDISQLQSRDGRLHHDRFVSLAALYPQIQQRPEAERFRAGAFMLDPAAARPAAVSDPPPAR
jgi:esterase/lipase superfamily enzyme